MTDGPYLILSERANDGQSAALDWPGGHGTFAVWGDFDGATVKLQVSFDEQAAWIDVQNAAFKQPGVINYRLPVCRLRADLSGAGASTSVSARL